MKINYSLEFKFLENVLCKRKYCNCPQGLVNDMTLIKYFHKGFTTFKKQSLQQAIKKTNSKKIIFVALQVFSNGF